jgi:hypothetical protein
MVSDHKGFFRQAIAELEDGAEPVPGMKAGLNGRAVRVEPDLTARACTRSNHKWAVEGSSHSVSTALASASEGQRKR